MSFMMAPRLTMSQNETAPNRCYSTQQDSRFSKDGHRNLPRPNQLVLYIVQRPPDR